MARNATSEASTRVQVGSGQTLKRRTMRPPAKLPAELTGDTSSAVAFMKPYMDELKAMAKEGLIAAPPEDMLTLYGGSMGAA